MDFDQKLDQRVKALEYEIKILKNEIQRTLLDIQEQILVHYFPDLRSDGGAADQQGAMNAIESLVQKKAQMDSTAQMAQRAAAAKTKAAQPQDPVTPEPVAMSSDEEAEPQLPPVAVQPVSLDQVRGSEKADDPVEGTDEASREQVAALSAWTTDTVSRIGPERTATIIASAVKRGIVPADSEVFLERLAAMGDGSKVPEKLAINHILNAVLALQQAAGLPANPEDAINLIDEANLG